MRTGPLLTCVYRTKDVSSLFISNTPSEGYELTQRHEQYRSPTVRRRVYRVLTDLCVLHILNACLETNPKPSAHLRRVYRTLVEASEDRKALYADPVSITLKLNYFLVPRKSATPHAVVDCLLGSTTQQCKGHEVLRKRVSKGQVC